MLLACSQCGGVVEWTLLGLIPIAVGFATSAINYVRKKLHERRSR
jgi:hypothetical protein